MGQGRSQIGVAEGEGVTSDGVTKGDSAIGKGVSGDMVWPVSEAPPTCTGRQPVNTANKVIIPKSNDALRKRE